MDRAGRHAWTFQTATAGRAIGLMVVATPQGATEKDFAQLDAITADAGAMLRRIKISVAP